RQGILWTAHKDVAGVPGHAHHLNGMAGIPHQMEVPSDGVLVGPILLYEGLIDHRHVLRLLVIAVVEVAPLEQGNTQSLEISRRYEIHHRHGSRLPRGRMIALN